MLKTRPHNPAAINMSKPTMRINQGFEFGKGTVVAKVVSKTVPANRARMTEMYMKRLI